MPSANKVKIVIQGMPYVINTPQPEGYVQELAKELDDCATQMLEKAPTLSLNDVFVLCAMNYADAYKHSEEGADRLRSQVQEYLEDAAKARIEMDEAKRETAALRRRLEEKEEQLHRLREKQRPPEPKQPQKQEEEQLEGQQQFEAEDKKPDGHAQGRKS